MKHLLKRLFAWLGIEVKRIPRSQAPAYFNTGALTPYEENSAELYDQFYRDKRALEAYYQDFRIRFYQNVLDEAKASGMSLGGKAILDVGCGIGYLASEIAKNEKTARVAGCDFSAAAVQESARRFPEIKFFQHDISLPLPEDHSYDVIFCTEVIEHLENPYEAVHHLARGLRPGGMLVLTVPDGRHDTLNEHINFWSPESWKVFIEREFPDSDTRVGKLGVGRYNFSIIKFKAD